MSRIVPMPTSSFKPLFTDESERGKNNFDVLRLLLAVAVIFTHSYALLYTDFAQREPLQVIDRQQMSLATMCVNFFFVISGFLITQSWLRSRGAWSYFKKRILRIYPAFLLVSIVCAFVVGPLGAADPHAYLHGVTLKHFLKKFIELKEPLFGYTFMSNPCQYLVDGSVWTIRYEFGCYILVALIGLIGLFKWRAAPLALFACAFGLFIYQQYTGWTFNHYQAVKILDKPDYWPRFLTMFLAGMVAYLYRDKIPRQRWLFFASVIACVMAVFSDHNLTIALPIAGVYALLYIASSQTINLHNFGSKVDLSYGTYLWAWPIQQLLVLYFGDKLNEWSLFFAATALTLIAATISWFLVERPALSLKNRTFKIADKPREPDAVPSALPADFSEAIAEQ